jgi:RimJ/RimL family protein N-acetyltransferase
MIPFPYPEGAAAEWIATHAELWETGKLATWAITRTDGDLVVGALSLRMTAAHRRAEAGYWVAPEYWGQGYATEALRAAVDWGFDVHGLHRIDAHHFVENPSSGRVMRKVGMQHEGRLRGVVFRAGVPRDFELYAILRTDPRA